MKTELRSTNWKKTSLNTDEFRHTEPRRQLKSIRAQLLKSCVACGCLTLDACWCTEGNIYTQKHNTFQRVSFRDECRAPTVQFRQKELRMVAEKPPSIYSTRLLHQQGRGWVMICGWIVWSEKQGPFRIAWSADATSARYIILILNNLLYKKMSFHTRQNTTDLAVMGLDTDRVMWQESLIDISPAEKKSVEDLWDSQNSSERGYTHQGTKWNHTRYISNNYNTVESLIFLSLKSNGKSFL